MTRLHAMAELGQYLGARVRARRLECGLTQDETARRAQEYGLSWDRASVAHIERGARELSVAELFLVPAILEIEIPDLLGKGAGSIALSETARATPKALAALVSGRSEDAMDDIRIRLPGARRALAKGLKLIQAAQAAASGEAERKAATRLKVPPIEVAIVAQQLWGRSLTTERDARVESRSPTSTGRARQAVRGHVTRVLLTELEPALRARMAKGKMR